MTQMPASQIKASQKPSRPRRIKAQMPKGSKVTRRRQQLDSSMQQLLPSQIPKSTYLQPASTQGIQNQLTKFVIRLPLAMFNEEIREYFVQCRLENLYILVRIQKTNDHVMLAAQIHRKTHGQDKEKGFDINNTEEETSLHVNFWGKYVYLSAYQLQNKVIKKQIKQLFSSIFTQIMLIKIKEVSSDMLIYLNLRAEQVYSEQYNGLINQGNTCYMNSYLQTLYHIPAFRNLVYEAETIDQTKFPATLQDLFFNLSSSDKPVSPQALVKSFGWGKKEATIQQDAQQFSCLFFQILERKLNDSCPKKGYINQSISQLFKGQLNHYLKCTNVSTQDKTMNNSSTSKFQCTRLSKNHSIPTLHNTEEYGLQDALKGVKVAYLPPVLMLQLKRFQYNFQEEKNIKILDRMEYQEFFDFSKWSTSQGHQLYQLYAVLVHQGARAQSGHYYNYIKTQQSWFKFNDQLVKKVTKNEVFEYNFGGYHQSLQFDAKQMKFQKKFIESKSTAYMLVYIKTSMKKYLMTDKKEYPEWLLKKDQNKIKMDQLKKNKKFYLYNVKIIDWESDLKGNSCSEFGFLDLEILGNIKTNVDQILKDSTILQWIQPSNKMQIQEDVPKSKNLKRVKKPSSQVGVYSYFVTPQREVLFSYVNYAQHKMGQLLKNITEPIIFKTPVKAKKSEYLVVCKRFILRRQNEYFERQFVYEDCFVVQKQILGKDFYQLLKARSIKQENIENQLKQKCKYNYYVESEKMGIQNVQTIGGRIPATIPNSNQLFICVIQQLPQSLTKQQQQLNGFQTFYKAKRNTISLIVINEKTREAYQLKQLNVMMSCEELRKCIYQILLQNKSEQYQSAQNIVLKIKQKKTSKIYHEITSTQKILNDLIKHDNKIEFSYSSITVQSRLVRRQLIFYYRFKSFMLSDPIKIIVEKNQGSEKIVSIIKCHQKTQQYLLNQGFDSNQVELFLLGKDKMIINDHIDNEGKIFSKGDLQSTLKKQKFSILIVQGAKQISISKRSPLIQIQKEQIKQQIVQDQQEEKQEKQEKEENHSCMIFLHHVSSNLDRVGFPLQFRLDKRMELVQLRNRILDLICDQSYQFQGKTFKCNLFKLGLRLFAKDMKKIVQLDDYQSLEQINDLNIEQKQPVISKSQKIQNVLEQKKQQKKRKMSTQVQSSIKKAVQPVQIQEQKAVPKQYQRIQTVFAKAKYLKVQVVHYQMIRPNIALKFNVDN